jgi:hypothetical protein
MKLPKTAVAACVYLLLCRDRTRFKLGWALDPVARICVLPEFSRRKLDLAASKAIWLPSRQRAEQVERSMHKALRPYRVAPEHRLDGWQEWFDGRAQQAALRLLRQMPLDNDSYVTASIVPLLKPPMLQSATQTEPTPDSSPASVVLGRVDRRSDPQSVWWSIEDRLIRLAMRYPVTVSGEHSPVITVHGLKSLPVQRLTKLRRIVFDTERWQCWRGNLPLSFIQTIGWEGDDLVLRFMPLQHIEQWEGGPELISQVQSFLLRLERQ